MYFLSRFHMLLHQEVWPNIMFYPWTKGPWFQIETYKTCQSSQNLFQTQPVKCIENVWELRPWLLSSNVWNGGGWSLGTRVGKKRKLEEYFRVFSHPLFWTPASCFHETPEVSGLLEPILAQHPLQIPPRPPNPDISEFSFLFIDHMP